MNSVRMIILLVFLIGLIQIVVGEKNECYYPRKEANIRMIFRYLACECSKKDNIDCVKRFSGTIENIKINVTLGFTSKDKPKLKEYIKSDYDIAIIKSLKEENLVFYSAGQKFSPNWENSIKNNKEGKKLIDHNEEYMLYWFEIFHAHALSKSYQECKKMYEEATEKKIKESYPGSIDLYRKISEECLSNDFGSLGLVQYAEAEKYFRRYNRAKNLYFKAWEFYKFSTIGSLGHQGAMDGLFNYIILRYETGLGDCSDFFEYIENYKSEVRLVKDKSGEKRLNLIKNIESDAKKICDKKLINEYGDCVPYDINGDSSDNIDIIFIADNYDVMDSSLPNFPDIKIGHSFLGDVDFVMRRFFSDESIGQYRSKFNVYYINKSFKGICNTTLNIFGDDSCDVDKINDLKFFKFCDADVIVVLSDTFFRSFAIPALRSGGMTFISTSKIFEIELIDRILKHEFGHAIYDLADEYIEKGMGDYPRRPNCFDTKEEAKNFWQEVLHLKEETEFNYFEGCSYTKDNFRGTRCTIMAGEWYCQLGDLLYLRSYGPINEAWIKKVMNSKKDSEEES